MVRVPVRPAPLFVATLNTTEPLPLPAVPDATVSHVALLVAVHEHPAAADTATVLPFVPDAATARLVGLRVTVHAVAGAPACVTVNVLAPTATLPTRARVDVLAETLNPKDPLRFPLDVVSAIQDTPMFAVQPHPVAAVTDTTPAPPAAGVETDAGCSVIVHVG